MSVGFILPETPPARGRARLRRGSSWPSSWSLGGERECSVRPRECVRDADLAGHAIDVLPPERAYLPLPHPRHEREEHGGGERVGDAPERLVELPHALGVEGVYRFRGPLRRVDEVEGVGRDVSQLARPDEGGLQQHVGVRDGISAVAVLHHVALELLDLTRAHLVYRSLPKCRSHEVLCVPAVAVCSGGKDGTTRFLKLDVVKNVTIEWSLAGNYSLGLFLFACRLRYLSTP